MELTANTSARAAGGSRVSLGTRAAGASGIALIVLLAALACGLAVVVHPPATRAAVAVSIGFTLLVIFDSNPRAGVVAALGYLALVAFLRRLLIPVAGWNSADPLLLVGPAIAGFLALRVFLAERSRALEGRLEILVALVFALVALQSLNPRNGSVAVGAGGLLFMGAPMLWFFVAREWFDERGFTRLIEFTMALGVGIALYGFYQSNFGLPSWDQAWTQVAGYSSLYLEQGVANTFATFSSSSEYTIFLGAAIAAATGLGLCGRQHALLALPVLLPAIFLSSNRTAFVFALTAVVVMVVLRFADPRRAPAVVAVCVIAIMAASPLIGSALRAGATATDNKRVQYQLSGLGDPLNREDSTATLHWQLFRDGVKSGVADPFGRGSGVTNASVARFGGGAESAANANTEVDLSNAFVSLGLIGGVAYVVLVVTAFTLAVRNYAALRDGVSLAVIGILIATLGHWLSGGYYAVSPLVWMVLGGAAAISVERLRREPA